jgi:PAS domain S-box-containing protein
MKDQSKSKQSLIKNKASLDALEYAENIINTVREPLIVLDQDLRVVTASRSFYEFFKAKPQETLGHLIYDLGNKQWDTPKLRELLETILPEKTTLDDYEVKHDFTTIGKRTMLLNARQIKRVLGKERLILLSIEDCTKSKQDEYARVSSLKALLESRERYRALFDLSLNLIYVMDFNGQFIDANKAALNLFGYNGKEITSVNLVSLMDKDQLLLASKIIQEITETGTQKDRVEFRLRHKDGRDIYLETQGSVVMSKGKPVAIQVIAHDITDRKQKEEALLASREQMRALASRLQVVREEERTRIARRIHDDMGGVLTGLKIDLSFMLKAALTMENKTIKKSLLDKIDGMIKSIDITVKDVRRLAMELRPGVLDDLGLVAALEWQLNDFQKRTGIHCKWISSVEYIKIDIDFSTAFFRIFQEVLTNVARHSGATEVRASLRTNEESFVLEVEDDGKGFEKEKLLNSESLGFLGMKERAQIFGGSVTITGKPGMGTKVTVTIPSEKKRKQVRQGDTK